MTVEKASSNRTKILVNAARGKHVLREEKKESEHVQKLKKLSNAPRLEDVQESSTL